MRNHIIALIAGLIFGVGLAVSEMINANKVLAFLDITGAWDPSLMLVLGAGLIVTGIGFRFIMGKGKPFFEDVFRLPSGKDVDAKLLIGAGIFGVGWGMGGYCPGPVIAAITLGFWEPIIFIAAMIAGSFAYKLMFERKA